MNEQEYIDIFNQLSAILQEKRLAWVVDQVNSLIKSGDVVKKDVEISDEGWQYSSVSRLPRRKQKASLLVVKEFSAKERLLLLIEAAERVLNDAIGMERAILNELVQGTNQANIVLYVSDDSEPLTINQQSIDIRNLDIQRVINLLQELRREVS